MRQAWQSISPQQVNSRGIRQIVHVISSALHWLFIVIPFTVISSFFLPCSAQHQEDWLPLRFSQLIQLILPLLWCTDTSLSFYHLMKYMSLFQAQMSSVWELGFITSFHGPSLFQAQWVGCESWLVLVHPSFKLRWVGYDIVCGCTVHFRLVEIEKCSKIRLQWHATQ